MGKTKHWSGASSSNPPQDRAGLLFVCVQRMLHYVDDIRHPVNISTSEGLKVRFPVIDIYRIHERSHLPCRRLE
jgi:hypothetical protein